jgi:hypothetical protein
MSIAISPGRVVGIVTPLALWSGVAANNAAAETDAVIASLPALPVSAFTLFIIRAIFNCTANGANKSGRLYINNTLVAAAIAAQNGGLFCLDTRVGLQFNNTDALASSIVSSAGGSNTISPIPVADPRTSPTTIKTTVQGTSTNDLNLIYLEVLGLTTSQ